jgi:hypothetical protein
MPGSVRMFAGRVAAGCFGGLALPALLSGCGASNIETGSQEQSAPSPVSRPEMPPPVPVAAEAEVGPLLDQLTQALRKYSAEKQRVPASLDELVAAGYLPQLPQAPNGKKFVINRQRVEVTVADR